VVFVALSYLQYEVELQPQLGLVGLPFLCHVDLLEIQVALQQRTLLESGELWSNFLSWMKLFLFTVST